VRVPELRLPAFIAALGVIAGLTLGASAVPVRCGSSRPARWRSCAGTALRLALLPDGALGGAERIAIGLAAAWPRPSSSRSGCRRCRRGSRPPAGAQGWAP